jgi:hypothetical protein
MNQGAHDRLAIAQAELVRALVAQGPIPPGFDTERVRVAARSLVNKRRQTVARVWQSLVRIVGSTYPERFAQYAQTHPLPACAAPLADGRAFVRWLAAQGPISDALRIEAMAFDLRWTVTTTAVQRRTGFAFHLLKRHESPGLVIAARIPWLGERWWGIGRK